MSNTRTFTRAAGAALTLTLSLAPAAAQTIWHVDVTGVPPGTGTSGDPYTSIQYALSRPSTVDGDQLLVRPGTYVENVDFLGKAVKVVSSSGAAVTAIDGGAGGAFLSAVTFQSGEGRGSVLEGFTVQNGWGTIDAAFTFTEGGGILILDSSPTIRDCVARDNEADKGGGIFGRNASPWIADCLVTHNNRAFVPASAWGGGLGFDGGSPTLTRVTSSDNYVGLRGGGAWFLDATASLSGCVLEDNDVTIEGAGAYLDGSSVTFHDCVIRLNNSSDDNGGGLFVDGSSSAAMYGCRIASNRVDNDHTGGGAYVAAGGSLQFFDGEIVDNFSARGGGIATEGALLHVEDSRICDNKARSILALDGNGGGVWIGPGAVTARFVRCVLDGNKAIPGFGAGGEGGAVYGPGYLEHCTVVLNGATKGGGVCGASMLNCIHWFNTPVGLCSPAFVNYTNKEGGYPGIGNIAVDPDLWDAAGGDYHLLLGSPCIDTGDPNSPPDPDGSRADMGAHPHDPAYSAPYCTAGTSASGCRAEIGSIGTPSATAANGFFLTALDVEADKDGLFFFGANGRQANPWGSGSSLQCVVPPVSRGALLTGVGAGGTCEGVFFFDLNARWCAACPKPSQNPGPGAVAQAQLWYRDPFSPSGTTTSMSDALEFQVQP